MKFPVFHLLLSFLFFLTPFAFGESEAEQELFSYINSERSREGLPALIWDSDLHPVAESHSRDMAKMGHISHTGSNGLQPHERIQAAQIFASRSAENVARDLNVVSAHTSLMESLYHRENILDPDVTHGATGIVSMGKYLYVTELFIKKVEEITLKEARRTLLSAMNEHREKKGLLPLSSSESLNTVAQSHVGVQEKLNSLSPPLMMNQLARKMRGSVRINVFTTATIDKIPSDVFPNLEMENQMVGIGFKRVKGKLCESGCYLVTLIFGLPAKVDG